MADRPATLRVYLPTTLPMLRAAAASGILASAPVRAHGVTSALRDWYVDADPVDLEEELEYAAAGDAAVSSLHLLAADPSAPRRRVVLAVDVPGADVVPVAPHSLVGVERSVLLVHRDVPRAALVSVHVDDEEAAGDVGAAVRALPAAEDGDEDARFVVDAAEGHELLWYDASEVEELLARA